MFNMHLSEFTEICLNRHGQVAFEFRTDILENIFRMAYVCQPLVIYQTTGEELQLMNIAADERNT